MRLRKSLDLLRNAMATNNSLLCCGLDPDVTKIPTELTSQGTTEESLWTFLELVIEMTSPHICAFKIQKAFFDVHPFGHSLLKKTISHIHNTHPELPVFLDCKIGDIDNTMQIYLQNMFHGLGADGIVVNPYMGDAVLRPFEDIPDKAALVIVRTSNKDSAIVQDVELADNRPLWRHILEISMKRWNKAGNVLPIVSSTVEMDFAYVRSVVPDTTPIFLAGYGKQGGRLNGLINLVDSRGSGVVVSSSRDLLYPEELWSQAWPLSIRNSAMRKQTQLNIARSHSRLLLILGVSGVGKSAIIREITKIDSRFIYISPYMTRPLRPDETDKIPVDADTLTRLETEGKILTTTQIYGVKYATPREPIEHALIGNNFPILDWPVSKLNLMRELFPERVFAVYVSPSDSNSLEKRLSDGRDPDATRLDKAREELDAHRRGDWQAEIDFEFVNKEGEILLAAHSVRAAYLAALNQAG